MKKNLLRFSLLWVLFFCVFFLMLAAFRASITPAVPDNEIPDNELYPALSFATTPGFYNENVTVFLDGAENCTVYYSTNGVVPESPEIKGAIRRYSPDKGIMLRAYSDKIKYYSITARAYYPDGTWGEEVCSTYVVGEGADSRFTTMSVFITCDPDKLFGYEEGIMVLGKTRDDWLAANPGVEPIAISPAGYNLRGWESEREVNVEFFDLEGNQVINQNVGVRVSGAYSRVVVLKSLKLFARKDYEEVNFRFDYPFYGDLYTEDGSGRLRLDFKRVLLRSTGSDVYIAQIRDELNQTAAAMAGFPVTQAVRPCSVYLNGEYYGCMWMHDVICDDYFIENYGEYPGVMGVVSGPEMQKPDERYEIDSIEEEQYIYDDYNAMYNKYKVADMTDDAVFEEFCQVVDVENYLFFYAINIYLNNADWPYNNHKAYRYYAAEGEEYQPGTVFDGRWRFVVHDTDGTFGENGNLLNLHVLSKTAARRSELFQALMKRQDCVDIFIEDLMEVMNGAFSQENYSNLISTMHEMRKAEATLYNATSRYATNSIENIELRLKEFYQFAKNRSKSLTRIDLPIAFGTSRDTYNIHISAPENAYIMTGNWKIDKEFNGLYIVEYGEDFEIFPHVGYEFSHWIVNGETIVYDRVLSLDVEDAVDRKNITVTPVVVRKTEDLRLTVYEYSASGSQDYIVLYNPYDTPISTEGYQLSDSDQKLGAYTLPNKIVQPGETVTVYCKDYVGKEALHQMGTSFNLRTGETLYLSYEYEILEEIPVIDLHSGYVCRRSLIDSKFYETKKD
ncbi:MAG: CotH kinase family protein [Clostridia bacterium]|nr:CotH kinase family protein [Clostridia bacterium]